jgi:site-specific recombinase XerC
MSFVRKATYCRTLDRSAVPDARRDLYLAPIQTSKTISDYQRVLEPWSAWCARNDRSELPATDADLIDFLLHKIDDEGMTSPLMMQFMAAISCLHVSNNCERQNGPELRALLKRCRLQHEVKKALPFGRSHVREMIDFAKAAYPPRRAARDAAMFAFLEETWERNEEMVNFDFENIVKLPRMWIINIPRSKGDPQGRGQRVRLRHRPDDAHCSICLLQDWLRLSGITSGPVFRRIYRGDHVANSDTPMKPGSVGDIVKEYCRILGFGEGYSFYSFRRGGATGHYQRTGDMESVQDRLRHKRRRTSVGYVDLDVNSTRAVLPYYAC